MPEWEEMHKEGNRPWDLKGVTPMLKYFIESEGEELQEVKRICVPGCGQKSDSEFLAMKFNESEVVGVDISPTAVKNCNETCDKNEFGSFDFVFDHTFFCAINPELRSDWGKKMGEITRKYLLTLIYPLPRDSENQVADLSTGPPFEVNFEAYDQVLKDSFECIKKWPSDSLPSSNEKRRGVEQLALWKRK